MKKVTAEYINELNATLRKIAQFSVLGKAGKTGVVAKREELCGLLFRHLSGTGKVAEKDEILNIASIANNEITSVEAYSSAVKQTLQRNVASACNLYLTTWCKPEDRVKITTKSIEYNTVDLEEETRLKLFKAYASLARKIEELAKTDKKVSLKTAQMYYNKMKVMQGVKPLKDEKIAIKARQDAMTQELFDSALTDFAGLKVNNG